MNYSSQITKKNKIKICTIVTFKHMHEKMPRKNVQLGERVEKGINSIVFVYRATHVAYRMIDLDNQHTEKRIVVAAKLSFSFGHVPALHGGSSGRIN